MPAQYLLSHRWRRLRYLLQQIDERVTIGAIQPIGILVARHRHLLHVLAQFDTRLAVDLNELVHTTQRRLSLAGNCKIHNIYNTFKISNVHKYSKLTQMRANAKAIDLVPLLVETQNGVLIDVVGRHNGQFVEPRHLESLRHLLERFACQAGKIGQIPGVDSNSKRMVAQIVEGQGHSAKIQQATPVEKKSQACV